MVRRLTELGLTVILTADGVGRVSLSSIPIFSLLKLSRRGTGVSLPYAYNPSRRLALFHLSSSDPDSINAGQPINDEKRRIAQPVLGFVPLDYSNGSCAIKERMTQALRYFKESTEQHVLAQVWAPVKNGDRYVLTTSGQPFVLDPNSNGLHQYRMASVMYAFSVDEESDGGLGLPGRVFRQKLPEWTPNVQFYSRKEYPRLNHALHYNVHGTLALPVFEPSGQSRVAVLELIMTSHKINYAPEVDKVCKALEAFSGRPPPVASMAVGQFFDPYEGETEFSPQLLLQSMLSQQDIILKEDHPLALDILFTISLSLLPVKLSLEPTGCGIQKSGLPVEEVKDMENSSKDFILENVVQVQLNKWEY